VIVRILGILLSALGCVAQERTATLVGTVNDSLGLPIENARVQIDSDAINIGPYSVKTDNLGHFQFVDIPPQTYHLEISVGGFKTWRKAEIRVLADQQTSLGEAFLILGTMCREEPSVHFIQRSSSVDETGTLRGSVLDGSGSPIVGARVSLKHCSKCVTKTNREGQFVFSNLTEKQYTLDISMKGFYREIFSDLFIAKTMDWTYSPVQLEPCPVGGCGQTERRQKPIELCF
jgi:hypothetical protein